VGKTRLAVEVARVISGSFANGVAFVPLATIRDPQLLLPTIARGIGLGETATRSAAEQVHDALYEREVLLVLDNLEQLIDAAHEIAALIDANAGLRVLATSRETLHLRAELRYPLAPLSTPKLPALVGSGPRSMPPRSRTRKPSSSSSTVCGPSNPGSS
jgi:predicted ATPase